MDEIEKQYQGLRTIVSKYDALKKRNKFLIPIIFVGSVLTIVVPPIGLISVLALIYWWASQWKFGFSTCPKCENYFFSTFTRLSCTASSSDPRYSTCNTCGLEVCALPEVECGKEESHNKEWLE